MNRSPRIEKLRKASIEIPAVCLERARYYTQSYKETQALPIITRRALAIKNVLENIPVHIYEQELIVGCHTSKRRGGSWLPEINGGWLLDELETVSQRTWEKYQPLTEEEKRIAPEIFDYWRGRTISDKWRALVPEKYLEMENIVQSGGYAQNCHYPGHVCIDYGRVINKGLLATMREMDELSDRLDPVDPEQVEKIRFYQAAKTVQGAVIRFGERYAQRAAELAQHADETRKAELLEISRICLRVPALPAESFREAVQSAWLMCICVMTECCGAGISMGRCDQYLYPFYERDLAQGKITRAEAQELISALLIKMNDVIMLQAGFLQEGFSGYPVMQGLTIGGVTRQGKDAVNELSYIILDSEEEVGLTAEELVVRVNRRNPDDYMNRAVEVARNLSGKLKFVSDDSTIPALLEFGLPEKAARDYISCGCHCPMVPGFNHIASGVIFNYPLMLELALNRGVHRHSGLQIGPDTGDPAKFASAAELEAAFHVQFDQAVKASFAYKYADMLLFGTEKPCPLISSFYTHCRERGEDLFARGSDPYSGHVTGVCGVPNVADSIAAVRKVVFEDQYTDMAGLAKALERNFSKDEELLRRLKAAPKFGNDIDSADQIAVRMLRRSGRVLCNHTTVFGRKGGLGLIGMTVNIPYGSILGAMPDGRLAGEPLSEGGISPYPGRNTSGMTAVFNSVCKIDHKFLENGSILNIRVSAGTCTTPDKVAKLAQMVRVFCQEGGNLVQFNFTSTQVLQDAQKNPDSYRDLLVRVATYSSYFVELSTTLQDNIISRTAMEA